MSGDLSWQEVVQEDYVLDFNVILRRLAPRSVAYAVCYLRSETEQRGLRMLVGSDDEAKVYLNGRMIYKYPVGRDFVEGARQISSATPLEPGSRYGRREG